MKTKSTKAVSPKAVEPKSVKVAERTPKKADAATDGSRRGRPPAKAFINVLVRTTTRSALNELKAVTGLKTQGEVLDALVSDVMKRRPIA